MSSTRAAGKHPIRHRDYAMCLAVSSFTLFWIIRMFPNQSFGWAALSQRCYTPFFCLCLPIMADH